MRRVHVWAAAATAGLALLAGVWFVLSPGWAVAMIADRVSAGLGRDFSASGGAHLEFSPLAIRLDGVSISNPADPDSAFIAALALRIPVSLGQLLLRRPELT